MYDAREQLQPAYSDGTLTAGRTPVRAAHVMELREAVEILESSTPSLEPYYTMLPIDVIDPSYRPHGHSSASTDLDGDGNEDLVLLGSTFPTSGVTAANYRPQPGRVFLGDGDGGFRRAPADLFPVDTLNTVSPRRDTPGGEGLDAARDLLARGAFGSWSCPSANRAPARAARRAQRPALTVYAIRHSFAAGLRRTGGDIADIQDLYGHTNPSTTMIHAPPELVRHQAATARLRLLESGVAPRRLAETAGSTGWLV